MNFTFYFQNFYLVNTEMTVMSLWFNKNAEKNVKQD